MALNIFNSVKFPGVKSSRFDLSHDVKFSFSMGELVPTCVLECIPGDMVNISTENMLRFAPLISPVMHKVNVRTDYFFVPTRLLWPEWEKWITGESDADAPYLPIPTDGVEVGSLCDYLGMPVGVPPAPLNVSPMQIAAYLKIYDEYYRDQNLQIERFVPLTPGDNTSDYETYFDGSVGGPLRRAWMHDYFTAALPFAQKGDAVQIPLTIQENIPVEFQTQAGGANVGGVMRAPNTGGAQGAGDITQDAGPVPFSATVHTAGAPSAYDPNGTLVVDVQSDATDINTLRRAFRLQEWLERNARGGTRYVENILAHFGIKSSDARLQRPEHIGSQRQNMVISEVLATAQSTTDGVAVGTMAGHGISVGGGNRMNYKCEEHGFVIGIINVQPVTAYQQGLHRQFTRFDRLEYAWPTFANIGEQEVRQKEVYLPTATPEAVFGYVPRYAEYKYLDSRVAGQFRSTLAFWHLGRIFDTDPALNENFIECNPRTDIFAVTDPTEDHIYAHVFNNISAIRKLPKFGTPTI